MRQREKQLGIQPDPVIDAFLRGKAMEGHRHSVTTDLTLRVLGLEVRDGAAAAYYRLYGCM